MENTASSVAAKPARFHQNRMENIMDDELIPVERETLEIEDEKTSQELFLIKRPFFKLYLWAIPVLVGLTDAYADRSPRRAKAALYVYLALARHVNGYTRRVKLRRATISKLAGVSFGQVGRSILTLERAGLITRWGQERGRCAVYEMLKDPPERCALARTLTKDDGARQRACRVRASAHAGCAPARNPLPATILHLQELPFQEHLLQERGTDAVASDELLQKKKSILIAIGLNDQEAAELADLKGCTAEIGDYTKIAGIFNREVEAGKINTPIAWLRAALLNHGNYDSDRASARNRIAEHRAGNRRLVLSYSEIQKFKGWANGDDADRANYANEVLRKAGAQ